MADLHFLTVRELAYKRAGPVLPVQVWKACDLDSSYDWTLPAFYSRRRAGSVRRAHHEDWPAIFAGKHLWILIHGFNVNRDNGFMGLGATVQELFSIGRLSPDPKTLPDDALALPLLWPGDWYLPAINYPLEYQDAERAGRFLGAFLTDSDLAVERVSFVTHSFGIRIALEALRHIHIKRHSISAPAFGTAIFMASADDNDVLDRRRYRSAVAHLEAIEVLTSRRDRTLRFAFPAGDLVEAALWRNQRTFRPALGRTGPKLPNDARAYKTTTWREIPDHEAVDHNDYLPSPGRQSKPGFRRNGWTDKSEKIFRLMNALTTGDAGYPWPAPRKPAGSSK